MKMSHQFPIEQGHILMFARAIGDPNPVYVDESYAAGTEVAGIIAPPTFVQASSHFDPEARNRPRIGVPWIGSGREPTGIPNANGGGTGLHAEQHFEYFDVLRPGDLLTCVTRQGATWEKQGRRGGHLRFSELITEFTNHLGERVVNRRTVSVRTERPVNQ